MISYTRILNRSSIDRNAVGKTIMVFSLFFSSLFSYPASAVDDVKLNVDWPSYIQQFNPIWKTLPTKPWDAPVVGNGLSGTYMIQNANSGEIRFEISRNDLIDQRANWVGRKTCGYFKLSFPAGVPKGTCELDLWNARIVSRLYVGNGHLDMRVFADEATNNVIFELDATGSDAANFSWEWIPDTRGWAGGTRPREVTGKASDPTYPPDAPPVYSLEPNDIHVSTQDLPNDPGHWRSGPGFDYGLSQHATAWKIVKGDTPGRTCIFTSLGFSFQKPQYHGKEEAIKNINDAAGRGMAAVQTAHQAWWHDYHQQGFATLPYQFERWGVLQAYKIASMTRSNQTWWLDLVGPWFDRDLMWNGYWYDWNVQTMYSSVFTRNHPELSLSLLNYLTENPGLLDSARDVAAWLFYPCVEYYEVTKDNERLPDIVSGLKKLYNSFLTGGRYGKAMFLDPADGKYHIPDGDSPEYDYPAANFTGINRQDTSFALAGFRWVCKSLMTLAPGDPDFPRWKEHLENIAPYGIDPKEGMMISPTIHFAIPHRHNSHEVMFWPYLDYTPDDPVQNQIISRTLEHHNRVGYEFYGMATATTAIIKAMQGDGNGALDRLAGRSWDSYLNEEFPWICHRSGRSAQGEGYWGDKANPDNHFQTYVEEGAYISDRAIQEMLLSSYNGVIRVFPAMPDYKNWDNVAISGFRAKGAFLISAKREDKVTKFIKVESLAGGTCKVRTGMDGVVEVASNHGCTLTDLGNTVVQINGLEAGQWAILYTGKSMPDLTISPIPHDRNNMDGINVALGKSATQSSTDGDRSASRAVDGNRHGYSDIPSFSRTLADTDAWWMVDLGRNYEIEKIKVWAFLDGSSLLDQSNYTISVLDDQGAQVWQKFMQTCPHPLGNSLNESQRPDTAAECVGPIYRTGRYVRIQHNNHAIGHQNLNLAEVEVYGR